MEIREAVWKAFDEIVEHAAPQRKSNLRDCATLHAYNIFDVTFSWLGVKNDSVCYRSEEVRDFTWRFAKNLFK